MKRIFDILFAACALLITWPLILIGALLVKLTSPGPAFYGAKRAGRGGHPFEMLKLRSMVVGGDVPERRITEDDDDRVTRVGALLRKFRIDELPQFWNVFRGDMSIVGPRPEDWDLVQKFYTLEQRRVLEVRPGVVSPADIRWYPDMTYHDPPPHGVSLQEHYLRHHLPAKLAEEGRYITRQRFLIDLKVIVQAAVCVTLRSWMTPPRKSVTLEPESHSRSLTNREGVIVEGKSTPGY
jgi:lipopolysaccharide/colanic/teichoic acid biosynthesis glycosyltransferase